MVSPLLTTKLHIPPPRPNLISRHRLLEALDEGQQLDRRLTLLSAPAGFGKTTLISDWVTGSNHPVAWVTLDETESDPIQFLRYIVAAIEQVVEGFGQEIETLLQSESDEALQNLIGMLINEIGSRNEAITLVLDDYHLITSPAVHELLQFLVRHQPMTLSLILTTRRDPPLPLAKLRARGQITEIRERDLRFTHEEAADFLTITMGLPLSAQSIEALEIRTEGWIVGLQLAALAMQRGDDDSGVFVSTFSGGNRYVMDYLIAEVLQKQPDHIQHFLRQTIFLDRLTASLCDAVTGRDDGQELLEYLEGANLFLIPLDHQRDWYRFHRLFSEFLRATINTEIRMEQHQKAAIWYESKGQMNEAIPHALSYVTLSRENNPNAHIIGMLPESGQATPEFIERLMVYTRGEAPRHRLDAQTLIEPLSERELEVLSLIVSGLTNAEIGKSLYIAVGTVKRHINNIYGKLSVGSRTQAVAKARELELLG